MGFSNKKWPRGCASVFLGAGANPSSTSDSAAVGSDEPNLSELTRILQAASGSGRPVSAELLPLVYDELRNVARERMSNLAAGQTLQPTALVHEAWLKLSSEEARSWNDRTHFFRAAAQAMRQILVDRARAKATRKRAIDPEALDMHQPDLADASVDERVLLVDEMMTRLEAEDPDSVRLITLKFFGGLTNQEIAAMDGVTERTVERHWAYAKALLYQMIREDTGDEEVPVD
jgi:RNA polymerase sigma factor (TIGR02999 family)